MSGVEATDTEKFRYFQNVEIKAFIQGRLGVVSALCKNIYGGFQIQAVKRLMIS